MDVSRMTLRQALSFCRRMELLRIIVVLEILSRQRILVFKMAWKSYLSLCLAAWKKIDEVECEVRLENASDHMEYVLYRNVDQVAVVDLWYKKE